MCLKKVNAHCYRPTCGFAYGQPMSSGDETGPNAITRHRPKERQPDCLADDLFRFEYDAAGQMLRYNGYDLGFDAEGRLVETSNVATGVRVVQHYDDAGERWISLVYRTGKPVEIHRFIAPEYQIRDGEEIWFAGGGSVTAEIIKSKGVKVDLFLLEQLTAYVAANDNDKVKPLPAEYMDLNGDGIVMDAADLQIAQDGYAAEQRVGGEKFVWKYITSDHLGGASHVTDSAGDVISHQRFHPYGKVASKVGQSAWRGGYIGKDIEPDADLGLQRIGARYYAPGLGRWVTPDPLIGQSPGLMVEQMVDSSLYSYASNSPLLLADPSGNIPVIPVPMPLRHVPAARSALKGAEVYYGMDDNDPGKPFAQSLMTHYAFGGGDKYTEKDGPGAAAWSSFLSARMAVRTSIHSALIRQTAALTGDAKTDPKGEIRLSISGVKFSELESMRLTLGTGTIELRAQYSMEKVGDKETIKITGIQAIWHDKGDLHGNKTTEMKDGSKVADSAFMGMGTPYDIEIMFDFPDQTLLVGQSSLPLGPAPADSAAAGSASESESK